MRSYYTTRNDVPLPSRKQQSPPQPAIDDNDADEQAQANLKSLMGGKAMKSMMATPSASSLGQAISKKQGKAKKSTKRGMY